MPHITINNASLYFEDSAPDSDKPVMFFAHGLLWGTHLFAKQIAHFNKEYRCIAFDFRGQGKSEVTKSGYDMDTLASDAIALLAALNIEQCHFIGLSMGGFVAQRVAIKRPDLLKTLILLDTSADAEEPKKYKAYKMLIKAITLLGVKLLAPKIAPIMFGETIRHDKSRKAEYKQLIKKLKENNKKGAVLATLGVIERKGVYEQLHQITTPTLIMVGDEDIATPYRKAQRIHFAIKGSKLALIQGAGHTSTLEAPEQVNQNIENFLELIK